MIGFRSRLVLLLLALASSGGARTLVVESTRQVADEWAPFEYLAGTWTGRAIPTADKLRGWREAHQWSLRFEKGNVIGFSVQWRENKILQSGVLRFDPSRRLYRLEGKDPGGLEVVFEGGLDDTRKILTLVRQAPGDEAERLVIRLLENGIRYLIWVERKDKRSPLPDRVIEIGLTRDGESFAAGARTSEGPKCVVTGGVATLNVTFQGKTYPLCCTGCRDEFLESPEKYLAKTKPQPTPVGPVSSRAEPAKGATPGSVETKSEPKPAPPTTPAAKPAPAPPRSRVEAADPNVKADSLLRLGNSLEKSKKPAQALLYYRRLLAEHPGTAQAKTASERIRALDPAKP